VESGLGTLAMLAFHHKVAKSTECCNIKVLQNTLLLDRQISTFWQSASFATTLASVLSKKKLDLKWEHWHSWHFIRKLIFVYLKVVCFAVPLYYNILYFLQLCDEMPALPVFPGLIPL
jgi:hypothetical protein